MIWTSAHEVRQWEEYYEAMENDAADTDWEFRIMLQVNAEKGDFDDLDPIIRDRILKVAYYDPSTKSNNRRKS